MSDFSQSLDVGETLKREEEVEEMSKKEGEEKSEESAEPEGAQKEEKKMAKKKPKKEAKKKEEFEDDDFDDDGDFGESGMGKYLFWLVVVIAAILLALWIFTDWKVCVQF